MTPDPKTALETMGLKAAQAVIGDGVRQVADPADGTPPNNAQLRRAVSTAYYALFHTILQAAAERFMGPGRERSPGFSLLYRSFDHGKTKTVCQKLGATSLSQDYQLHLARTSVSQDIRDVANAFVGLQEERHKADYDPTARFLVSNVTSDIEMAITAIEAFGRLHVDESTDVLALMMVGGRV